MKLIVWQTTELGEDVNWAIDEVPMTFRWGNLVVFCKGEEVEIPISEIQSIHWDDSEEKNNEQL